MALERLKTNHTASTADPFALLLHQLGERERDTLRQAAALGTRAPKESFCDGWEAELASAYLEQVLDAKTRCAFELHLSLCSGCRQHLIALRRLGEDIAPAVIAAPEVVLSASLWGASWTWLKQPAQAWAHAWRTSKAQLANWFVFPQWQLGLATGTALTLLVTVGTWQLWQRETTQQQMPLASAVSAPGANSGSTTNRDAVAAASIAATTPSLATTAQPFNQAATETATTANRSFVAVSAERTREAGNVMVVQASATLPQTPVVPKPQLEASIALATNGTSYGVAANRTLTPAMLPTAIQSFAAAAPSPVSMNTRDVAELRSNSVAPATSAEAMMPAQPVATNGSLLARTVMFGERRVSGRSGEAGGLFPLAQSRAEINFSTEELASLGLRREMAAQQQAERLAEERDKAKAVAAAARKSGNIGSLVRSGMAFSFLSEKSNTGAGRTKDVTKEAIKSEAVAKPLIKHVNGHTFYFDHGFWIDAAYRSDTSLPIVRLMRSSAAYQQAVIENPSLDPFFQLGQVIVVWRGKVYEVRK